MYWKIPCNLQVLKSKTTWCCELQPLWTPETTVWKQATLKKAAKNKVTWLQKAPKAKKDDNSNESV